MLRYFWQISNSLEFLTNIYTYSTMQWIMNFEFSHILSLEEKFVTKKL